MKHEDFTIGYMDDVVQYYYPEGDTMQTTHRLEIRQGIWIDEQWLKEAGLGRYVQVIMLAGEIRIQAVSQTDTSALPSEKGWDILRTIGNNAPVGRLKNAAEDHDLYLYGFYPASITSS